MTYNLGEMVEGKGVFMGCVPLFKNFGLTQAFNVFAAPGDFMGADKTPMQAQFNEAVEFVSLLDSFHENQGLAVASEEALYETYKAGAYNGEWVLPSYTAMKKAIAANRNEGEFKDSYAKAGFLTFEGPEYYWVLRDDENCSEASNMFCVDTERFLTKTVYEKPEASMRLMRFEPA